LPPPSPAPAEIKPLSPPQFLGRETGDSGSAPSSAPVSAPKRTIPASFRLSEAAHAKLFGQAAAAGISTRAWLEQAVIDNKTNITAKPKLHPDYRELLYQVNKAGNNVNQLAHHFNSLALKGSVRPSEVALALSALERISQTLQEVLDRAR
jgi:hypothetical protein